MSASTFFQHYNHFGTQDLLEQNVIESIQIMGIDVYYIRRNDIDLDYLFLEDLTHVFSNGRKIEMYLSEVNGFAGQSHLFSAFELEIRDSATFVVSKSRFKEEYGEDVRPLEGDLIFFPLSKSLLEITYVDYEDPFYQAGRQYVYSLKTELYESNRDTFITGVPEIDEKNTNLIDESLIENHPIADNIDIEDEADDLVFFSPDNPFGID